MAAVTAAIIGAGVGVAALVNTVEQQNQQRRLAGQRAVGARVDADNAIAAQKENDRQQERIAVRDKQKSDQNRVDGGIADASPSPLAPTGPANSAGGTLLGT